MSTSAMSIPESSIHENFEPEVMPTKSGCIPQLPYQRERIARMHGACFTMLVVGETGLGKSTFIRSLLGSEFTTQRQTSVDASAEALSANLAPSSPRAAASGPAPALKAPFPPTALSESLPSKSSASVPAVSAGLRSNVHSTAEIEVHHAIVTENGFETDLTIIDTPGFGDYTDNTNTWIPVASYIDAQHQYYMCQEEQPDRSQLRDTRVHLCLYFLAPTGRVLELDLVAMRELGRRVNLVPIIAKGDSMTPEDLTAFKQHVRLALAEHKIQPWTPLQESEQWSKTWPFAVASSDESVVLPSGKTTKGRKYRWGIVDICNPEHSDFMMLRDLLFGQHLLDLVDRTSTVHYARQRRCLRLVRLRRALNLDGNPRHNETGDQAKRGIKLLPSDRASLAFMGPSLRLLAPEEVSGETDVAQEAMQSMDALDLLLAISKVGQQFLNQERHENDVLLRQRTFALKAQFDVVIKFQEERFEAQAANLERTRDQLSQEIAGLSDYNEQLVSEIRDLELGRKKK